MVADLSPLPQRGHFPPFPRCGSSHDFGNLVRVSPGRDRSFQNVVRSAKQFGQGFVVQSGNFGRGMHPRAEKNFVRVNVADTGDNPLVHQDRFHSATMFSQNFPEFPETEIKCVRSQSRALSEIHRHLLANRSGQTGVDRRTPGDGCWRKQTALAHIAGLVRRF